ncbi:MAG TPA: glycosyltransferase family 2 protein [Candidatus Dormibacteraeota bacterium]|jgi:hypothetical protein|nr:glycosyltransferase family 2 protein [Candidatus Dormibacteraeota bacterium]
MTRGEWPATAPTGLVLGAVVVNWNDLDRSLACLGSACSNSEAVIPILVDNGSEARHQLNAQNGFSGIMPGLELVRLEANRGYAAGLNAGAARAFDLGATHVLLLNNDLEFELNAITVLLKASLQHPDSILAPVVAYADRPTVIWGAGGTVQRPWMENHHLHQGEAVARATSGVVEWASGCALLASKAVWEKVGPWDERYFLYEEDIDWCLRAAARGVTTWCVAESVFRHEVSRTAGRVLTDPTVLYYGCRNTHRLALIHNRGWAIKGWVVLTAAWSLLKAGLRLALFRSRRHDPLHRARCRALLDFLRGRFGPAPAMEPGPGIGSTAEAMIA